MAFYHGLARKRKTMLPGTDNNQPSTLHLRVVGYDGHAPMPAAECVIDRTDGKLGRADDNDLVLPDQEGVVSRVHARIEYTDGTYCLVDQSTNGTSLGEPQRALESGVAVPLADGDLILIGPFTLRAEITPVGTGINPELSTDRLIDLDAPSTKPDPFAPDEGQLEPLSEMDGWSSEARRPDWFPVGDEEQSPAAELPPTPPPQRASPLDQHMRAPRGTIPGGEAAPPPQAAPESDHVPTGYIPFGDQFDDFPSSLLADEIAKAQPSTPNEPLQQGDESPAPLPVTPAGPVKPPSAASAQPVAEATIDTALLDAFLRGLDMSSYRVPPEKAPEVMQQFGELARESVQGLIDILRLRAEFKHEFYVPATSIAPIANNLFKYSVNSTDAISRWLADSDQRAYMGPAQSTRQAFQDLAAHQLALIAGMEAAVDALLKRFAPNVLEERIGKATVVEGMMPQVRRARLWEAFESEYRQIADQAAEDFQEILGQHFARAYTEQIKRLEQVGFGAKGPDNAQ
jgi:type VI secretion system protein